LNVTSFSPAVSGYAKKTTAQVETLTYNDRHRVNQKMTVDKKEKSPRFAFLISIFVGSASTHLQFSIHTGKHTIPKLPKDFAFANRQMGKLIFVPSPAFSNLLNNP